MVNNIKLFDTIFGKEENNAALKVLKNRFWALGFGTEYVKEFEKIFK